MKVTINRGECIGDGLCEEICPEVFEIKEGIAYLVNENPDEALRSKIEEAMGECSTECIAIVEE